MTARAYRERDMLYVPQWDVGKEIPLNVDPRSMIPDAMTVFPIPAISHIALDKTVAVSVVEIGNGGPAPWRYEFYRPNTDEHSEQARYLMHEINEAIADWLADHYPNLKRDDT